MPAKYEIFSGTEFDPFWLATAEGLRNATERMEEYAAKTPGRYFVFCFVRQRKVAEIDTSHSSAEKCRPQAKSASAE